MIRYTAARILDNAPLKIISFIIGYSLWHMMSSGRSAQCTLDVPLCFHSTPPTTVITAPEKVTVTIQAPRLSLAAIDMNKLAVHVDASILKPGGQLLEITPEKLFLPERVSVVYYEPLNLTIQVASQTPLLPHSEIA